MSVFGDWSVRYSSPGEGDLVFTVKSADLLQDRYWCLARTINTHSFLSMASHVERFGTKAVYIRVRRDKLLFFCTVEVRR